MEKYKKKYNKIKEDIHGLEKYPEFESLVDSLIKKYIHPMLKDINNESHKIKSDMPYKAQFVLEEILNKVKKEYV